VWASAGLQIVYDLVTHAATGVYAAERESAERGTPRATTEPAVSYPGVGRFRRAEAGILGVEHWGPAWAPFLFVPRRFLALTVADSHGFTSRPTSKSIRPAIAEPARRGAFFAGNFELVQTGENLADGRKLMPAREPLSGELAIAVRDVDGRMQEAAS